MNITKNTVSNPVLVLIVFSMIALLGLAVIKDIEINLMPDIKQPFLMVSAAYSNAGPETVESSVTQIIEEALVTVTNLKKITSTSSEGSCEIGLEFSYGTNLDAAANQVRDALDEIKDQFPSGMKSPAIYKMSMNESALMDIVVLGNRSESELKYIAEKKIKRQLLQANGVAQASVFGGKIPAVRVDLSQNRLSAFGLTVSEVAGKLAQENMDFGAGKITENTTNYVLRTKGTYKTVEEIAGTIIAQRNGCNIRLDDIGKVYMGFENSIDEVFINGQSGVYISIKKQSGANAVKVAGNVYEKLEEIKETLPSDVELKLISDESESIRDALNTLYESAWQGILLAVLILFVFLKNFKSTFIVGISIPVSIVMTLLLMHTMHITLNLMTLTGLILGIGMVVDASIVMIDNIYSYRMRGTKAKVSAVLGTQEMISSVISGNLTTIVVFVPFLIFMNSLEWIGLMAKDLIYTIVSAIISSLFVAIFLVPVLAGVCLPLSNPKEKPVRNRLLIFLYGIFDIVFEGIKKAYLAVLKLALRHKFITLAAAIAMLLGSLGLIGMINIEGFPESEGQAVTLNVTLPAGTSLEKTKKIVRAFERYAMEEVSGYTTIFSSVGSSDGEEMMMATNCGSLSVFLPPASRQQDTPSSVKAKLLSHFEEFPGAQLIFASDSMENFSGADVDICIKGPDLAMVREAANSIIAVLQDSPDLMNVKMDLKTGLPQIEIDIDRKRANALGVSVEAAAMEINSCISGVNATRYRVKGNEYNVIVSLQNKDKENLLDLDRICVQGTGGTVALSNFARLKKSFGPVSIKHENSSRTVHITASFKNQENAFNLNDKIKESVSSNCCIPSDVIVDFGGSDRMMKEKGSVFAKIIVLAVLLVFGVMASMYGSMKKPFINMLTIPFLLIGVVLIHVLTGQSLSIMSLLGLVMLVGIVVNNGIILVDYTGILIARGSSVETACYKAGESRLRPVLMTTLTTVLGMLPMCFSKTGSSSLVQPIGMCVVGGLLSSTFVTLVIIPVIYSVMCRKEKGDVLYAGLEADMEQKNVRMEIIANQSVQEDVVELLECKINGIEYTMEENVLGKGKRSRKLGSSVWPEMNFKMTVYCSAKEAEEISCLMEQIKQKYRDEGISFFTLN